MNIFVNCNNLNVFKEFVKTYSEENKKHHFIFGRQDVNYDLQNTDRELVQILTENDIVDYELLHASTVDYAVPNEWKTDFYKLCSKCAEPYNTQNTEIIVRIIENRYRCCVLKKI